MKCIPSALAALVAASSLTAAHAATYQIDKSHSTVSFKIRHVASKVTGWFKDVDGTIDYDPTKPEKASVKATIQTASVDTHVEARDKHLKSADFFDVEKYPTMTFTSTKVKKTGEGQFSVDGTLELHGVKKPVTLAVTFNGEDKLGKDVRAGFSAQTRIKRTDFNVVWNKTLESGGMILGDDVSINLEIEGVKGAAAPAPAPKKSGQ